MSKGEEVPVTGTPTVKVLPSVHVIVKTTAPDVGLLQVKVTLVIRLPNPGPELKTKEPES
jgi:hypothetical protein